MLPATALLATTIVATAPTVSVTTCPDAFSPAGAALAITTSGDDAGSRVPAAGSSRTFPVGAAPAPPVAPIGGSAPPATGTGADGGETPDEKTSPEADETAEPPADVPSPAAPAPAPPAAPDPDRTLTEEEQADLDFNHDILTGDGTDLSLRTRAAERLLAMHARPAWTVLAEQLGAGRREPLLAVTRALETARASAGDAAGPVPAPLLDGIVGALGGADGPLRDRLAVLLMTDRERSVPAAARTATDPMRPIADRIAATDVLSVLATRAAVDALLELAAPPTDAPANGLDPVRQAAFAGLRRLSPIDHGADHAAWTDWWSRTRREPAERWWLDLRDRDRRIIADLRLRHATVAERHVDALRQLYLALPLERQVERLPLDLSDDLAHVRLFATGRIERLLRDSVAMPDAVRASLLDRLDDPDPRVRTAGIRLLETMDEPTLAARLVPVLESATDPAVVAACLDVLTARTVPEALDALLARLERRATADPAARALWLLLRRHPLEGDALAGLAGRVRSAAKGTPTAPVLRVLALCGNEDDLLALEARMTADAAAEAPAIATAVAEGFLARGRVDRVLAHADVPAVAPLAIRGLVDGRRDLTGLRRLLAIEVPDERRDSWMEGVQTLALGLPASEVLEADRLLEASDRVDASVRKALLTSGTMLQSSALTPSDRAEMLLRVAPILEADEEDRRLHELLEDYGAGLSIPAVADRRFLAAVRVGEFDVAAGIASDPTRWVDLLATIVDDDVEAARRLAAEIRRRFPDLEADLRERYDTMVALIGVDDAAPPPAGG